MVLPNVEECHRELILVDDACGAPARRDLAEGAQLGVVAEQGFTRH
jgi:hypothetical protein